LFITAFNRRICEIFNETFPPNPRAAGAGISADGLYYFLSPETMHYNEAVQFCQRHLDLYQLAQQRIDVNFWPVIGQHMQRLIEGKTGWLLLY
jgi:hypothetical protein